MTTTKFDIETHLAAARLKLLQARPYFSTAIFNLTFIKANSCPTMGVDRYWRLYYNEEWVKNLSVEETSAVLYHEILHLIRVHWQRAIDRGVVGEVWNIAADMEINDDLKDEFDDTSIKSFGMVLPNSAIFPEHGNFPKYLSAEDYYNRLFANATKVAGSSNSVTGGSCGSGAGNKPGNYELGEPSDLHPGKTVDESEIIKRQVATDAQNHQKQIGHIPDHIKDFIDKITAMPTIPWQRILSNKVRSVATYCAGMHDYTYSKPNKRSGKIIYPSFRGVNLNVAAIIDTSGSMSSLDLEHALAEISSIIKSCCPQGLAVFSVDADVHSKKRSVRTVSQIELIGRGGTDMRVGILAAHKLKPRPDLIIVITDGYTPWPASKPRIPIIVCLVADTGVTSTVPAWANVVVVKR